MRRLVLVGPALLCLHLLADLTGCRKCDSTPASGAAVRVARLDIRREPPHAPSLPDSGQLRSRVVSALARAQNLAFDAGSQNARGPRYNLTVAVQAGHPQAEQPPEEQVAAAIWLRARRTDDRDAPPVEVTVMVPAQRAQPSLGVRIGHALDQAVAELDYQTALDVGPPAGVIRELRKAPSNQHLLLAVDAAARRRLAPAVPELVKLLKHADQRIADRTIGALVSIGDRSAVAPLARLAKFNDTEKLAKLIDGIAQIGGPEARSYLEFVVGGHPDPDIQDMAREALSRMDRTHPRKN